MGNKPALSSTWLQKIKATFANVLKGDKFCVKSCYSVCFSSILPALVVSLTVTAIAMYSNLFSKRTEAVLFNNPDIVIRSIQNKEAQLQKEREQRVKSMQLNVPKISAEIFEDAAKRDLIFGDENAAGKIIMIYDFNCSFCKKMHDIIRNVVINKKLAKLVLIDYPMLTDDSILAARAAIYVSEKHPKKLLKFYFALGAKNIVNESKILEVAKELSISTEGISAAIKQQTYDERLRSNIKHVNDCGIDVVPAIIVNGKLKLGYAEEEEILNMLK